MKNISASAVNGLKSLLLSTGTILHPTVDGFLWIPDPIVYPNATLNTVRNFVEGLVQAPFSVCVEYHITHLVVGEENDSKVYVGWRSDGLNPNTHRFTWGANGPLRNRAFDHLVSIV
jgi:hypothetical protein